MSSAALAAAPGQSSLPAWQRALLFAAAYFLLAEVGRFMSVRDSTYTSFWLPSGLYVAVLLMNESRAWPLLVLAAFAGNLAFDLSHGTNLAVALLFSLANALQSVGGAWLVRRFVAHRPTLTTLAEFVGFMGFSAVLSNLAGAAIGAGTLVAFGLSESFSQSWKVWWGSNAMAILLVSPFLLTWNSGSRTILHPFAQPARTVEAALLLLLLAGLTWHLLFLDQGIMVPDKGRMVLPLLWAALRFGPHGAAAASVLLALPVAYFTTQWFAGLTPGQIASGEYVFVMQTMLAVGALIALIPAIVLSERDGKMQELRESETRLRLAVQASNVGLWIWDIAGSRLYLSPEWKSQIGFRDDEIRNRYDEWESRLHPDDRETVLPRLKAYLADPGPSYETEFRLRHKDGSYRWIYARAQVESDASGRPQRMLGCHIDITERKRAESGAAELAAIVRSSDDAVVSMTPAGVILTWNEGAERLFGHTAQQAIGQPISLVYPRGEELVAQRNIEAIKQGERHYEVERRRRDGSAVPVSVTAFPIPGPAGEVAGIGAIYRDITRRKEAQAALSASEQRYRALFESSPLPMWVRDDTTFQFLAVNQAAVDKYGYTREEFAAMTTHDIRPAAVREAYLKEVTARPRGGVVSAQRTHVTKDGRTMTVQVISRPFMYGARPARLVIAEDITERLRAERALRDSEEIWRVTFSQANVGITMTWMDMRYREVNDQYCRIVGYTRDELLAMSARDITRPEDLLEMVEFRERLVAGQAVMLHREKQLVRKDGSLVWVSLATSLVRGENGTPSHFLTVVQDIANRKRAEEELQRSLSRQQELSRRLVEVQETERRGINRELHDRVGQNLATLSLHLGMIRSELKGKTLRAVGPRMNDSHQLLGDTIAQVRNLMAELRPAALDDYGLVAALRTYASEYSRRFGTDVSVDGPARRLALTAEIALFRIAQEALNNVAKHAGATKVDIGLDETDGVVVFSITDNGAGFDPSKLRSSAQSWGMTIMRERAEAVGATLTISSSPGRGTRVEAALPKDAT